MEDVLLVLLGLAFVPALIKIYYINKLERVNGRFWPHPITWFKMVLYWAWPFLKSDNPKKQPIIKKLNLLTAIFWGMIALVLLLELAYFAFLPGD